MTGRDVAIVGASLTLQHVPDLVRYGSKPRREQERLPQIQSALRSFSDAVDYPPNQVFIGNAEPDILRDLRVPGGGTRRRAIRAARSATSWISARSTSCSPSSISSSWCV